MIAQLAYRAVARLGDEGRYPPVAQAVQLAHRAARRAHVLYGDGGVLPARERPEAVRERAADEGDRDGAEVLRRVVRAPAEEDEAPELLLPLHRRAPRDLVLAYVYLLHHHRAAGGVYLPLDGLDYVCKKGVRHPAHHEAHGVRIHPDQVPGAVVRHIVAAAHRLKHRGPDRRAHVRPVVKHARDRAHRNPALPRNVLDCHSTHSPGGCQKTFPVTLPVLWHNFNTFVRIVNANQTAFENFDVLDNICPLCFEHFAERKNFPARY